MIHVGAGGEREYDKNCIYHYFEPREDDAIRALTKMGTETVNTYQIALSDYKGERTLNITKKVGCSSFLEPNLELIKILQPDSWSRFEIDRQIKVKVDRLDNIIEAGTAIHKLTIDTQGTELEVLKGAGDLLNTTQTIQCEIEYVQLYKDQPLLEAIENYLTTFGFKLQFFVRKVHWGHSYPIFGDAIFENKSL